MIDRHPAGLPKQQQPITSLAQQPKTMTGSRYRRRKGRPPGKTGNIVLPEGGDQVLLLVAANALNDELLQGRQPRMSYGNR
jgi:hypothetical protein